MSQFREHIRSKIAESPLIYPHTPEGFIRKIRYQIWSRLAETDFNIDLVAERSRLPADIIWQFLIDDSDHDDIRTFALVVYGMGIEFNFDVKLREHV